MAIVSTAGGLSSVRDLTWLSSAGDRSKDMMFIVVCDGKAGIGESGSRGCVYCCASDYGRLTFLSQVAGWVGYLLAWPYQTSRLNGHRPLRSRKFAAPRHLQPTRPCLSKYYFTPSLRLPISNIKILLVLVSSFLWSFCGFSYLQNGYISATEPLPGLSGKSVA